MATHSSVVAWRIPWTEEPGGLLSMGSHRVRHDWSDLAAAAAAVEVDLCIGQERWRRWAAHAFCGACAGGMCSSLLLLQTPPKWQLGFGLSVVLPMHHQLLEFTQTHVSWVIDAIQPSHPLSSPSPPAFNLSQSGSFPMNYYRTLNIVPCTIQ